MYDKSFCRKQVHFVLKNYIKINSDFSNFLKKYYSLQIASGIINSLHFINVQLVAHMPFLAKTVKYAIYSKISFNKSCFHEIPFKKMVGLDFWNIHL